MDQVLIQIVMDDQGEVSLEYLADLVRLLSPEEIRQAADPLGGRAGQAQRQPDQLLPWPVRREFATTEPWHLGEKTNQRNPPQGRGSANIFPNLFSLNIM